MHSIYLFCTQMLTGLPPFYDTNVQRMYHKILHEPLRFPKTEGRQLSEDARDLIRGLLDRKVSARKGSGPTGESTVFLLDLVCPYTCARKPLHLLLFLCGRFLLYSPVNCCFPISFRCGRAQKESLFGRVRFRAHHGERVRG